MQVSTERSGVKDWSQYLATKPLPVKSQTIQQLKSALAQPNTALQSLVPIIAADPAFTLHLIQKANQLNLNSDVEANSVEQGVSMLGMDHLTELIDAVPIIKLNLNSVPHRWYFRCLNNSLHAGLQAADFCIFPNPKVIADTQLAALFYSVGHWALWRYAPIEMAKIKDGIYRRGESPGTAERSVLGCTIREISTQLVQHWKLSALALEALKSSISPDKKTLTNLQVFTTTPDALSEDQQKTMRHLMSSQYYPVKLANWLMQATEISWDSDIAHILQQCVTDQLKTDSSQGRARVLNNVLQASRRFHTPGLLAPGAKLLLLPSNHSLPYQVGQPASQAKAKAVATAKEPETATQPKKNPLDTPVLPPYIINDEFKSKTLFQQACQRLLNIESPLENEQQVHKLLTKALKEALGLQRICLLKIEEQSASVALISGFVKQDPMRRFSQKLSVPGLLNKLTKKPSAVLMDTNNRLQVKMQMSERLQACTHQTSFALMSLHVNAKPNLVIYADHGELPVDVSDFFFQYFKVICNAASKHINQLALAPKDS